MSTYGNLTTAFLGELENVVGDGAHVRVRGSLTRESLSRVIEIESVRDRQLRVVGRNNNIFATIAESMWVLAGRDDLEYLSAYLPRALDFSDDGSTWRGAYGPRLRKWNGTDQLAEVLAILRGDPTSRRAVAVLFDPDRDFGKSKDIPCNNWLHFIARDGVLNLNVTARSTDIWWGFSGINAFEWCFLLEVVSFWLGMPPGRLTFFTSSLHLYERHFESAARLLATDQRGDASMASLQRAPHFATSWEDFEVELSEWMRVEHGMRLGATLQNLSSQLRDPLLTAYAQMLDVFWAFKRGADPVALQDALTQLGDSELAFAAEEFIRRPHALEH